MNEIDNRAHEPAASIRRRTWDVFISYAREDSAIARSLGEAIERRGLTCWLDAKLGIGEPLQHIDQALRSSGAVIVLLSAASLSSPWVRREVASAVDALPSGSVFPVAVGEVDVRNLPVWLADRQWLHLRDGRHVNKLVEQLLPALDAALGGRDGGVGTATVIGELPPRVPSVGVDAYLRGLRGKHTGITWIVGMGGVGKTTLAREYAFAARNEVDFIWWLPGAGAHELDLRQQLGNVEDRKRPAGLGRGLIVVDGLDAVSDGVSELVSYLTKLGALHRILITTRRASDLRHTLERDHDVLTIGALSEAAVVDFLDLYAPELRPQARADLQRIAQTAGGSPILLRLLTQALQHDPLDDLLSATLTPETTINRTLQVLMEQLSKNDRRRLDVLSLCSGLLTTVRSNKQWRLPGDDALFGRLLRWGFFTEQADGALFAHPLIVSFLRRNAPRQALEDAIAYVTPRLPDPGAADSQRLLTGVVELTELTELGWSQDVSANLAELLIWQASVWRSAGQPGRAEILCPRAFMLAEESEQALLQIRAMNLQSALAFDQGRLAEASAIERRTAELALAELGPDHPISIGSLANLATSLHAQGDLPEAITLLRQVVDRSRATLPYGHPDLVGALSNLAVCLRGAGLIQEAMELLREAIELTTSDRVRLQLDELLAVLMADAGRLEEASIVLRDSLARAATGDVRRSDLLTARTNLAVIYAQLGRLNEAVSIQSEVVDQFDVIYGPEDPHTLRARSSYAMLLIQAGSPAEALQFLMEVAITRTKLLGPDHPDTMQSLLLATRAARSQGDDQRALSMYSDLLARVVRVLGPDHAMSFTVREELAQQLDRVGDASAAQLAYRELFADLQRALSPDHPMLRRVEAVAARFAR